MARTSVRSTLFLLAALGLVGAVLASGVSGRAASAEPYSGSTTTSTPSRPAPRILLDRSNVTPNSQIRIRACGYDLGTSVKFTKDGDSIGSKDAVSDPPRGCDPPFDAAENAGPYAELTFTVAPNDPDSHFLCAVAPGFPAACASFTVAAGGATVLAFSTSQSGSSGSPFNPLAFTGFALLFWLAMALVALFLGYVCLHWARDRRARVSA